MLWLFLISTTHGAVLVDIGQNFTGSTFPTDSAFVPPDCNGAAGPNEFVELINGRFSVYAKTNGSCLLSTNSQSFWISAGVEFDSGVLVSDPRIIYEPTVARWFACTIDFKPSSLTTNRFLVAVSQSADPTGGWTNVAFVADPDNGNFADFPTLGIDSNGVYIAAHMFDANEIPIGDTLVSIPKADLLLSEPTATNRTSFGILNSDYGVVFQPVVNLGASSSGAKVLAVGSLGIDFLPHSNLVSFAVLNAADTNALLTAPTNIIVPGYNVPINPTQPDGNNTLDDGDNRFSAMVRQVDGILYATHGCQVSNRAAIRWYKINATNDALIQSGTIFDPDLDLFYPSIAANESGTVVIGFNGCSTNTFVSIYAVAGETVEGVTTFGDLLLLKAGLASYLYVVQNGISRWGDYTATCVDPVDPNRFWTAQMYPSNTNAWATQITELITRIVLEPKLSIARAGTNALVSWPLTTNNFQLEFATIFASSNFWSPVLETPSTNGNEISVLAPAADETRFFRLKMVP